MTLFLPKKNSKYGLTVEEGLVKTTPDAHLILDSFSLPQGPCQVARSLRALWTPAVLRRVSASSREGADRPLPACAVRFRGEADRKRSPRGSEALPALPCGASV